MIGGIHVIFKQKTDRADCLVSKYASQQWSPDADHWLHTARHEAGHAVALVCMYKKFGKSSASFERILIRPGATVPYVTRRGRSSDCLGCVERGSSESVPPRVDGRRAPCARDPDAKRALAVDLEIKIVSDLAGPLAEMCSWNETAELDSKEYGWAREDNVDEIRSAEQDIDDLRALSGRGSVRCFEDASYHLVKQQWAAIVALAHELMRRRHLNYDKALSIIAPLLV
jgi:hypothetical protein